MTFNELKKNLKKDFTGFKPLKLALLGDSATQFLAQAIRGAGYEQQLDINVYDAGYNQLDRQILDLSSELYMFQPDISLIFEAGHKLLQKFNKTEADARGAFAENQINRIGQLVDTLQSNLKTKVICFNYAEEDDCVFGNFANKVPSSFIFQERKLNYLLAEYAAKNAVFYVCDMSAIQSKLGRDLLFSPSIYINSEMVLSIDALPVVSESVVRMIAAFQGKHKKCIILDLDNTVWGGVIGDDGLENIQIGGLGIGKAFTEFQYWVKKLQQRGIIVGVCSKNTESVAKEPFEKHPDMVLRLKDIAVFVANWENKANNIKRIQQFLNIGFDSMVFLDDDPAERDIVRQNVPDISVPELPKDPAEYLEYLYTLNLFETVSYSSEDANRTEQYQKESKRVAAQASFINEGDFLKSLEMLSAVQPFNSFSAPRVAQLSQRSNQFNLRTVRYSEEDINRIIDSVRHHSFSFTLEDKYGDNGLICAVILEEQQPKELFIDTWFMSCRVLKRGMENFVLNTIVDYARNKGYHTIVGKYLPTAKNALVKDHYSNLGFTKDGALWRLEVATYHSKKCFINTKE
jgi:FkbH-like protein